MYINYDKIVSVQETVRVGGAKILPHNIICYDVYLAGIIRSRL